MQNHGPVYVQQRDGVRRHGTLEDVINFYKLGQVSPVSTIVGQVNVDPHELTGSTKQRRITHELLRHSDKPMLSYPGESHETNRQVFEMAAHTGPMAELCGLAGGRLTVHSGACGQNLRGTAGKSPDLLGAELNNALARYAAKDQGTAGSIRI